MNARKYSIEMALQLSTTHWHLLQLDGFKGARVHTAQTGASFNVYAILERPRTSVEPTMLAFDGCRITGELVIADASGGKRVPFVLPVGFDASGAEVESPYPHTTLRLVRDGEELSAGKLALLAPYMETPPLQLLQYRVVYVGQAQEGGRDAVDRLSNHETLQAIMHDVITQRPHNEVWLLLLDFESSTVWQMDGRSPSAEVGIEESIAHVATVEEHIAADRTQLVNLVEASLIRYFRPEYNERYKKTFPSPRHSTYTAVYEHDLNAFVMSLTTMGPMRIFLGSDAVTSNCFHVVEFPLHKKKLRHYMFDLFAEVGQVSDEAN